MIIMIAANKMNPTAQPLVAFPARPAGWYCDGDCSVICRSLLVWLCPAASTPDQPPGCIVNATVPPGPGSGVTLQRMNL
jgi:hypothetical protein